MCRILLSQTLTLRQRERREGQSEYRLEREIDRERERELDLPRCQTQQRQDSPSIIEESQPVKNRNLSRLLANLSQVNCSRQRNCVYCFSAVFTLLQKQEVPSTSPANWPAKLFFFSTLFTTPTVHPVENLCARNRHFSVFMLTTAGTFSTNIPASHFYSPSASRTSRSFCSLSSLYSSVSKDTGSVKSRELRVNPVRS